MTLHWEYNNFNGVDLYGIATSTISIQIKGDDGTKYTGFLVEAYESHQQTFICFIGALGTPSIGDIDVPPGEYLYELYTIENKLIQNGKLYINGTMPGEITQIIIT